MGRLQGFQEPRAHVQRRRGEGSPVSPRRRRRRGGLHLPRVQAPGCPLARGPAPVHRAHGGGPTHRRLLRLGVPRVQGDEPEAGSVPTVLPVVGARAPRVHEHLHSHR